MRELALTKVCEVEDFEHPSLVARLHELVVHRLGYLPGGYPAGREDRHEWEAAMALWALASTGVLRPDATVLAVAAGADDLVFHVARSVRQLFLADRYLNGGGCSWMLTEPEAWGPVPVDPGRMVVQHMDGRALRFPDDTFDGVICTSRLPLDSLLDAAHAAYEVGRVLKPGGVASFGLDVRLAGPPWQSGWPHRPLMSRQHVQRFVVDASGLAVVGEPLNGVSKATMSSPRVLSMTPPVGGRPEPGGLPNLIRVEGGHAFTSAHLTLRKTGQYPFVPNAWARPTMSRHP